MEPIAKRNADGTITLTITQEQGLAIASGLQDQNLPGGREVQQALIGSSRWLRMGGEGADGVISRDAYDTFRSDNGLPLEPG